MIDQYPDFPQTTNSAGDDLDDINVQRASNGAARGRVLWSGVKRRFNIEHDLLHSEVADLRDFYADHRAEPFEFVWSMDGQTYVVMFTASIRERPNGGLRSRISVTLEEV